MEEFMLELSNRADAGGHPPGPHGAHDTQRVHLNSSPASSSLSRPNSELLKSAPLSIPLPSGSIVSPVPALKSLNLAQAVLDGLAVLIGFLFLAILFGSLPLAIGLLIFAEFH
jgi:hypothetical protein